MVAYSHDLEHASYSPTNLVEKSKIMVSPTRSHTMSRLQAFTQVDAHDRDFLSLSRLTSKATAVRENVPREDTAKG